MIIEHVWEYNFDPETKILESCIYRLRDKTELNPGEAFDMGQKNRQQSCDLVCC